MQDTTAQQAQQPAAQPAAAPAPAVPFQHLLQFSHDLVTSLVNFLNHEKINAVANSETRVEVTVDNLTDVLNMIITNDKHKLHHRATQLSYFYNAARKVNELRAQLNANPNDKLVQAEVLVFVRSLTEKNGIIDFLANNYNTESKDVLLVNDQKPAVTYKLCGLQLHYTKNSYLAKQLTKFAALWTSELADVKEFPQLKVLGKSSCCKLDLIQCELMTPTAIKSIPLTRELKTIAKGKTPNLAAGSEEFTSVQSSYETLRKVDVTAQKLIDEKAAQKAAEAAAKAAEAKAQEEAAAAAKAAEAKAQEDAAAAKAAEAKDQEDAAAAKAAEAKAQEDATAKAAETTPAAAPVAPEEVLPPLVDVTAPAPAADSTTPAPVVITPVADAPVAPAADAPVETAPAADAPAASTTTAPASTLFQPAPAAEQEPAPAQEQAADKSSEEDNSKEETCVIF